MDIKTYAAILLVVRIISMGFIFFVLRRQWALFKLPIAPHIRNFRKVLFTLALIVFVGNIVPAAIDILTVFSDIDRTARVVKPVSYVYTITAAGTALVSSYLIWRLYRLAADEKEVTELTEHRLENEKVSEYKRGKRNG